MATKTQLAKIEKLANAFGFFGKYNRENAWCKIGRAWPFAFFTMDGCSAELYMTAEGQNIIMQMTDCNGTIIDWTIFHTPAQFVEIMAKVINNK